MLIRVPSKKILAIFLLTYELKRCQKAVDFLREYYGIRRMRIVVDGRRVGNGDMAAYFENKAFFSRRGLNKRTVLHELCHHLISVNRLEMSETKEERAADGYARDFLN